MKNFKKFFYVIIFLIVISTIYEIYPKQTTVNQILISNNLSEIRFDPLFIFHNSSSEQVIKDKNKINNLLSYIKKLKIVKLLKPNKQFRNGTKYVFIFYTNDSDDSILVILNKNFIEIDLRTPYKTTFTTYKIIGGLNLNFIKNIK